jgi:hypothetical protein
MFEWSLVMRAWIEGYEDLYSVTRDGEVYRHLNGGGYMISQKIDRSGYRCVTLNRKSEPGAPRSECRKDFPVHRLVYRAFVGEIPPNHYVRHIDWDKSNNALGNLYLTAQKKGWRGLATWTIQDLVTVKQCLASGWSPQEIQLFYGGSLSSIERIRDGQFTVKV